MNPHVLHKGETFEHREGDCNIFIYGLEMTIIVTEVCVTLVCKYLIYFVLGCIISFLFAAVVYNTI